MKFEKDKSYVFNKDKCIKALVNSQTITKLRELKEWCQLQDKQEIAVITKEVGALPNGQRVLREWCDEC